MVNSLIEHVKNATRSMTAASYLLSHALTYSTDPEVNKFLFVLQTETASYVETAYPQTSTLMREISRILKFYLAAEHGYRHFLQYRDSVLQRYDSAERLALSIIETHRTVRQRLAELSVQVTNASNTCRQDADKTKHDADQLLLREREYRQLFDDLTAKIQNAEAMAYQHGQQAYLASQNLQDSQIRERQARDDLERTQDELKTAKENFGKAQREYNDANSKATSYHAQADSANNNASRAEREASELEDKAQDKKDQAKVAKVGSIFALGTAIFDGGSHSAAWAAGAGGLRLAAANLRKQAESKRDHARSCRSTARSHRGEALTWSSKATYWQGQANIYGNSIKTLQSSIGTLTKSVTDLRTEANTYEQYVNYYQNAVGHFTTERDKYQTDASESSMQAQTCREMADKAQLDEGYLRSRIEKLDKAVTEFGQFIGALENVSGAVHELGKFASAMRTRLRDTREDSLDVEEEGMFNVLKSSAWRIIETCDAYRDLEPEMDRVKELVSGRR